MTLTDTRPAATVEDLVAREAVLTSIAHMFELVDHHQADRTLELCADDFVMSAVGMTFERPQYDELMAGRTHAAYDTRHAFSNVQFGFEHAGGARVRYLVSVLRREHDDDSVSQSVADFEDRWVRHGAVWRLAERSIELAIDTLPAARRGV